MIDWIEIGKRYPLPAGCVPEKPWWRDPHAQVEVPEIVYPSPPWGTIVGGSGGTPDPRPYDPRYPRYPYVRTDGAVVYVDANQERSPVLDAYDREHPLPVPGPACQQVWIDARTEVSVVAISAGWVFTIRPEAGIFSGSATLRGCHPNEWPPPGAVLVAGPGAPWQAPP